MLTEKDSEFWHAPAWYRGLSLAERLASRPVEMDGVAASPGGTADEAPRRLQAWRAQKPFDQEAVFVERLALNSLSEQEFVSLLTEPVESLQARISTAPGWLVALRDAFSSPDAAERMLPLIEDVRTNDALDGCLPAVSPLLQRGLISVQERVQALRQQHEFLPFDTEMLPRAFLTNIVFDLLPQISKAAVLEMHIARLRGELQGETPEARFEDFLRRLSQEGQILSLLAKYPVLARQLVITVDHWADYLGELLTHLCADWEAIRAALAPGSDPGLLVEVEAGKGDRHRRGRSVLLLRFGSGLRLVYKPKPLAVDLHFQEVLAWLNERGADPCLRPLKLIDRGDHGWSEFVVAAPCSSEEEVARFYERQGSYLALLHALDATDFHNENLIAAGEHPMFIDLEALFHPHVDDNVALQAGNLASQAMNQSVWQVGILPQRIWIEKDTPGMEMSGLGGQAGQTMPYPLVGWKDAGSDQMRLIRRHIEMPVRENRPRLGDREIDVLDYKDAIITGFTKMYRLLCEQRDAVLAEQLPRFAHDEVRVIVRPTRMYGALLYESYHPDLLRDALDRDRFFDHLWAEVPHRPYLARVVAAEQQDLWQGDIPLFSTHPGSRTIFTSSGEPIVDFLATPSLEVARQRVQRLGEQDLAKQIWIIDASLATLVMGRENAVQSRLPIKPVDHPVEREHLVVLAKAVGRRLEDLALQNDAGAYWLGLGLVDQFNWGLFPAGTELYDGTSGIALFLAYLGAITGEPSNTLVARRALASLHAQIRDQAEDPSTRPVGGFCGLGSTIYLLTHLGVLWNEPALLSEAEELVDALPAAIAKDDFLDILYGSAGCTLALLGLHAVHPSHRALEVALQCGDRLIAAAQPMAQGTGWKTFKDQPPLSGFSHGAAGIALSLLKLAASSGEQRFHQAALGALAYERSLFVPALNNWADLRVFPERPGRKQADEAPIESGPRTMVAWCHGAAGIGLGRLGALDVLDDARIREEIDCALNRTIQHGFTGNHSLCHGALGNVELLLAAARLLGRPEDHEALEQAKALIVGSIEGGGWASGVPLGVETPGFMIGLAGIGYELLRLAEPDKVPSVLILAPPCS